MNTLVRYGSGAIVLLAAISLGSFTMLASPPAQEEAHATRAQPEPLVEKRREDRLKAEVASLETRVAAIQASLVEKAAADTDEPGEPGEEPSREPAAALTPQESRAQSDAEWQAHMLEVAAAFEEEPLEKAWAVEKRELVESHLEGNPILNAAARNVECRSHTCRVELTGKHAEVNNELGMFVHKLGPVLPRAKAERIEEPDGQVTMVLYVSERKEQPIDPRAASRSD
jgi:hypothetical protein